jgi:hypothetical protein
VNKPLIATVFLFACNETSFTQIEKVDSFQQKRRNTFDLMLVVDNSCSMYEEQAKLASNFDSFIEYFDGTDVDWQLGVVLTDVEEPTAQGNLIGGDDEIVLTNADSNEQDRVAYTHDWAVSEGMAMVLDPSWYTAVSNDKLEHWCAVAGGTPGDANATCGLATEGAGADSRYGKVIITEFMADPTGVADDLGEWVELTNISDAVVDVSNWQLVDDGRNAYTFPDAVYIEPGDTLVVARSVDTAANGGVTADLATGEDFTMNNDLLYLTGDTEGAREIFQEMVAQGISGSGSEMGLEAVRLATTAEMIAGHNAGFIRPEANFNILVVSDEEDSSPDPVDTYLSEFAMLKGEAAFRDHTLMNVSAVVGSEPPEFAGEASCVSANGAAVYGHRYVDAVSKTGGLVDSICDDDFSPLVSQLGLTLSGLQAEFELSHYPVLESLKVALYNSPDTESKERDLTLDTDYTYVEERNSLRFEFGQVPASEQYIVAEYKVRSGT